MSKEALKRRLQRALDSVGDREPHPSPMEPRLPKIANDVDLKNELAKHADVALWIREIELVDRALRVWPEPALDDSAFDAMAARIEQRLDEDLPALPEDPTEAPRFEDSDAGMTYDAVSGGLAGLTAAAKAAGPPPPPVPNTGGPARAVVAPPPPPPPVPGATRQRGDPTLKGIAPPPPPPPSGASKSAREKPSAAKPASVPAKAAKPVDGEERLSLSSMEEVREQDDRISVADRVSLTDVGVEVRDEASVVAIGAQVPSSEPPEASGREIGERISFSTALRAPKLAALDHPSLDAPRKESARPPSEVPAASRKAAEEARSDRRDSRPAAAPVISLDSARDRAQTVTAAKEGRSMFWPTVAGVCALAAAAVIAITVQQRSASPGSVAQLDESAERSAASPTSAVAPSAPALAVPPAPAPAEPEMVPTGTLAAVGPESPTARDPSSGAVGPESPFNQPGAMPPGAMGGAPSAAAAAAPAQTYRGVGGAALADGTVTGAGGRTVDSLAEADQPASADEGGFDRQARDSAGRAPVQARMAQTTTATTPARTALRSERERADDDRRRGAGGAAGAGTTEVARAPARPTVAAPATPPPTAPAAPTPRRPTPAEEPPVDPATLPETLDRAAVVRGFAGVAAEVRGCSTDDRHGVAQVDVTIASSGRVVGAVVSGGQFAGTPIGSCVARAVRRARFPRFRNASVRVSYPFNL